MGGRFVLVVCGLAREAAIAAGSGVRPLAAGGSRLLGQIETAIAEGAAGIVSFGIAGGLDPDLPTGAAILARSIVAGTDRLNTNEAWRRRLASALPDARDGDLAGVDLPVLTVDAKQRLRRATGALAVDMESHIAARLAAAAGIPFAALRVVCDPAGHAVPAAAVAGLRDDGTTDVGAVLRALLGNPPELPGLVRLAFDARKAFAELSRRRRSLGGGFKFPGMEQAAIQ